MSFTAIADIGKNLLCFTPIDTVFTEVTRIGQQTLRLTQLFFHCFQRGKRGFYSLLFVWLLSKVILYDQMGSGINRRLGIVGLNKPSG